MYEEYFYYDETSPSCLRWKKRPHRSGVNVGDIAGCQAPDGYWKTKCKGIQDYAHRVVYFLFYGDIPDDLMIDHINRDGSDNRIENLRLASDRQNVSNRSLSVNNNTGVKGVKYREYKYSKVYICSWIDEDKVQRCKSFTIGKYTEEEAFRLACEHRKKIVEELNQAGLFYNN